MATRADGSILIDIIADPKKALNGIQSVEKGVNGLASTAKKLTGILVAAFAVDKIVQFGKEAIELGSDVAEVQNVVDVAFGDMAYMVEDFADTAITSFGMSELAAKRTASTYMAMASNMGVTQQQAAEMAITLAGLTGDVASFYNISQELADIKLRSVFTGETETLKDLGIVMTQANLEAYALANGINRSFQSMSQSEQLILRYNYVLDQLSLASGDFVRTQDSWANQTRILSMQWQEFMSIIGQALIQVLLPVVQTLNKIVSALIDMANALNAALTSLFGGTSKQIQQTQSDVSGVSSGIGDAVENQDALTDATKETNQAQKKSLSNFDQINKLSMETANAASGGGSSGAGSAMDLNSAQIPTTTVTSEFETGVLETQLKKLSELLRGAFKPFEESFQTSLSTILTGLSGLFGTIRGIWDDIKTLGSPLVSWFGDEFTTFLNTFISNVGIIVGGLLESVSMVLSDLWNSLLFPALQQFVNSILPALTEFATEVMDTFGALFGAIKSIFDQIWKEGIAPALEIIAEIWMGLWEEILRVWDEHGAPIFDLIRTAITTAADTLSNIWETVVKPVWDTFMSVLDQVWNDHLRPLWGNIVDFAAALAESALKIYNEFIAPLVNWFVNTFGPPIADALNLIIENAGVVLGAMADTVNGILDALTGVLDFVTGVFTGDWELAWQGVQEIFKGVWNAMVSNVEGAVNLVISGINWMIGQLNKLSFTVPDWVPEIGGGTFGFNIPPMKELSIPRLARGAVIPPNREFLAVLGDQRSGYNYEVPDDKLRQLIREETAGLREAKEIRLVVTAGDSLVRELKIRLDRESQRQGVSLVKGGVL